MGWYSLEIVCGCHGKVLHFLQICLNSWSFGSFLFCLSSVKIPWVSDIIFQKPVLSLLIYRCLLYG